MNSGAFQGGTNYDISDFSGSAELRIDQNASDLVNASIPEEPIEITGVVEQFNGTYQLKPRDSNDIEIEVFETVGDDIPKDKTFDVVTWNMEWFGSTGNGPDDEDTSDEQRHYGCGNNRCRSIRASGDFKRNTLFCTG